MPTLSTSMFIDDRSSQGLASNLGTTWRLVTDNVMGGVSNGRLVPTTLNGQPCLRLTGQVSLANNGGFVQASLDLSLTGTLDARAYNGIELRVWGNGENYNVHLRNLDTRIVWQSYRACFQAAPYWQNVRLPFAGFQPYRIDRPLDLQHLRRLGLVAIGCEMVVDLCVANIALY